MFSETQFDEWVAEAKSIAMEYKTMVIGTSHTDGSFRNCGTSIPIAYCIGSDGEAIFLSKNDLNPVIVDTVLKSRTPLKGPIPQLKYTEKRDVLLSRLFPRKT